MPRMSLTRRECLKLAGGAVALGAFPRVAYSAPLAQRPPMGWNSFDSYGVYLHEEASLANVDAMAEKLQPHGYEYFVVDNGWFGEYTLFPGTKIAREKHASDVRINAYGLLQPSTCYFPNGLEPIIQRCHEKGLKFGVHLMRGIPRKAVAENTPIQGTQYRARDIADTSSVCSWCEYNYGVDMDKPGAQAFYNSLVNQLAGWGIDFIKADDIVPFPKEVEAMAEAIAQCGRPIVLSLSPGGDVDPAHIDAFRRANMLRVTPDIWDEQKGIDQCFDAWRKWQGKERPGFWIDMDMIPFGQLCLMSPPEYASSKGHGGPDAKEGLVALAGKGTTRQCLFTKAQMETFITMRAVSASPLMVGGDLPTMDAVSLGYLTHPEMLACNQNGVMGALLREHAPFEVWGAAERGRAGHGWIGVFNRSETDATFQTSAENLGLEASVTRVKDVWNQCERGVGKDGEVVQVPAYGALFLRY